MDLNDPRTAVTTRKEQVIEDEAQRWHQVRQTATRVVCSHAHDATDARNLLDMLDLNPTTDTEHTPDTETDPTQPAASSALLALGHPS